MLTQNQDTVHAPDPTEKLQSLPLVGETVTLPNGAVFQKPHPDMIRALQALDPRVHYLPTDLEKAGQSEAGGAYYKGVAAVLPAQILQDFPGDKLRTAQRGTVVSLRDEFPHYQSEETGELLQMNNVLTILRTGSDRGGPVGKLGVLDEDLELYHRTADWLMMHTDSEIEILQSAGQAELADNLFPGLLVYERELLATQDPQALLAVYITDRQVKNA